MSEAGATGGPERMIDRVARSPLDRVLRVWHDEYDTIRHWPRGARHLVRRAVVITVVDTLALMFAAWLMPQVAVDDLLSALADRKSTRLNSSH